MNQQSPMAGTAAARKALLLLSCVDVAAVVWEDYYCRVLMLLPLRGEISTTSATRPPLIHKLGKYIIGVYNWIKWENCNWNPLSSQL